MKQLILQLIESIENDLEEISFNLVNDAKVTADDTNKLVFKAQELRELIFKLNT